MNGIKLKMYYLNYKNILKSGKIRYVGLSNETPWGVNKFLQLSKELNLPRMMSIQNPYSLLNRSYEVGLAEISIRDEIGCLAYSPLASGYLTGKYRNGNFQKVQELKEMEIFGQDIINQIWKMQLRNIIKLQKNII